MSSSKSRWVQKCNDLIEACRKNPLTYYFNNPVEFNDAQADEDYRSIVKNPLCIMTVKDNLSHGKYQTQKEFLADFMLIYDNAIAYHSQRNGPLFVCIAKYLKKELEKEYKNRFERTSNVAYYYSQYLMILREKITNDKDMPELTDFTKVGKAFEEPVLSLLADRLNDVITEANSPEVAKILNVQQTGTNQTVELSDISPEQVSQLWDFVFKYQNNNNSNSNNTNNNTNNNK